MGREARDEHDRRNMLRAGIALGAAWLLALALATAALPARGASPATLGGSGTPLPAGVQATSASGGVPGTPQVCPPECVPSCAVAQCVGGSDAGVPPAAADEGENTSLATVLLVLLCLVGVSYGAVKLLQRRRSTGARVFRLPERPARTPGLEDEIRLSPAEPVPAPSPAGSPTPRVTP